MLIDVAISGDRNVIKKEDEKILKYKDLTIEIQCMWKVKTRMIPVIIGATETISKSLRKYISNISGNHNVAGRWPATSWVHYTTSCNTQSSAPEDGKNNCPKYVELTGIINKPLLVHLVGCLYYLYFIILF